jgi:hypothetical protein
VKLFKPAAKLDQSEYDEKVAAGLDRAFKGAGTRDVQLAQLRLVIRSDLHRGARDGADDFQRYEPAYSAALGWYLERGYELYLLGDVEELWENDIGEVLPRYADCMKLERAFMDGPGLTRFFGNHDVDWNADVFDTLALANAKSAIAQQWFADGRWRPALGAHREHRARSAASSARGHSSGRHRAGRDAHALEARVRRARGPVAWLHVHRDRSEPADQREHGAAPHPQPLRQARRER